VYWLLAVILAHVLASYCAAEFYYENNFRMTPFPFGGWLAPVYLLGDYIKYTLHTNDLDPEEGQGIVLCWVVYLVPLILFIALADWLLCRWEQTEDPSE
jgi:hypothetical protein